MPLGSFTELNGALSQATMSFWPTLFPSWLRKGRKKGKKKKVVARVQEDTFGRATVRSLGGFSLGMTLSAAYGALVIFGQGYSIWYCLLSTITLALALGLGMAFSFKVRVTVLLMLPQFFSSKCPLHLKAPLPKRNTGCPPLTTRTDRQTSTAKRDG